MPEFLPDDSVITDNFSSRKQPRTGAHIAAAGAQLLLDPLMHPQFDSTESVLTKFKTLLRRSTESSVHGL